MALRWSWAFGPESAATLNNVGWACPGNFVATSTAGETYTYSGSPTRYACKITGNNSNMNLPLTPFTTVTQGWIAAPIKILTPVLPFFSLDMLAVRGTTGDLVTARIVGATGALALYVDNVFKANTIPYDWSDWKYVALQFDVGTATFAGRIFVDGVAATASFTDAATAQTSVNFRIQSSANNTIWGQFVVWDSTGDAGQNPVYVTRAEPTSDNGGATVGTWTPSIGVNNWAVLDSPIDSSTYTQEAAPLSGERVAVNTSTLSTALGTTPPNIYGMTLHTYSAGQAISARARVSDDSGVTWDSGASTLIDGVNVTYAFATSTDKPSSGGLNTPWAPGDVVTLAYEVV